MNGMKAKAEAKKLREQFTEDGLPKNANDWLEEDWADLHRAIEEIKDRVAARHGNAKPCSYCKGNHKPEDWCSQKQAAWRKK